MANEAVNLLPDDFDEAFQSLSMDDPAPEAEAEDEPIEDDEVAESDAESEDEPIEDGKVAERETESEGEPAEDAEAAEGEAEDAPTEDVEPEAAESDEEASEEPVEPEPSNENATLERLADLIAQAQKGSKDAEPPKDQPTTAEDEPEVYTEDELEVLEEYEKEWPEVARAEQLRRRGEYRQVVDYVFNEIAQQIAPMAQMVQALSERTHLQELQDAVGDDYDTMREDVVQWVDEQPTYLQAAYKHVIDNGTVDEVADLINRFKSETGRAAPPQAAAPTQKKETELPATTKKAAASLAPVSSKRSAVPKGEDPTDFESAFSRFAGKL